jgi:hypothetical protein
MEGICPPLTYPKHLYNIIGIGARYNVVRKEFFERLKTAKKTEKLEEFVWKV